VNIVLSVPTCNTLCNNPATTAGQQHKWQCTAWSEIN
jgi:hypothetical protein